HRGGDALDAQRGPLPGARLLRSALGAGDAPGLREPARVVALDRRRHHGRRHAGHDVAVGGRAPCGGVRARPSAGAGRVRRTVLALALILAAPAVAATQQEVEESLTCQCGCGLTVHACNHLQCGSGEPMKKEISERLATGETKEAILDAFRARYGEKVLSSPTFHGFNWLAWIIPFAAVAAGGLGLAVAIGRWGARSTTAAPAVPEASGALR